MSLKITILYDCEMCNEKTINDEKSPQLQREGPIFKDLRLTSVDMWRFESIKIVRVKLAEIVIVWVYYTIPFCFSLIYHFSTF